MSDSDSLTHQYKLVREQTNQNNIDKLQMALDALGLEPTIGTAADVTNAIISGARAIASKDRQKEHLANTAISLISMIPFADVVKLAKKPYRAAALSAAKSLKSAGQTAHTQRGYQSGTSLTNSLSNDTSQW